LAGVGLAGVGLAGVGSATLLSARRRSTRPCCCWRWPWPGWTVVAREAFSAIVGFLSLGLVLMLIWMRLAAPDVALTEGAIGTGLNGMLLLGAASRLRSRAMTPSDHSPERVRRIVVGVLCSAVVFGLIVAVASLPSPAPSLAGPVRDALPATQLENPVTGVLMAFRGLDTLLEKVVLFLALVGVWCLAPDRAWGTEPSVPLAPHFGPNQSGALVFLARVLPPFWIALGIYLAWNGSIEPGGAFPGGAVLAAMVLLVLVAGLRKAPSISRRWVRLIVVAGPVAFIVIAFAGYPLAGAFLAYPERWAKAVIVLVEAMMLLSIAATLSLLLLGPPGQESPT